MAPLPLLVKAAWGGHSLYKLFRSPSAGFPEAMLQKELQEAQARVRQENEQKQQSAPRPSLEDLKKEYGSSYRKMLAEVKDVQEHCGELFPELAGRSTELAGMVWFQGWNDQYGAEQEYASNMKYFIEDLRQDLQAPGLPVVIAAMGQNGSKAAQGAMLVVREAQLSMNEVPEFRGNVRSFRTDLLVDRAAEEMYPRWKESPEWVHTGGDHPYHYFGSAIWFTRIGRGMGEAMLELLKSRP